MGNLRRVETNSGRPLGPQEVQGPEADHGAAASREGSETPTIEPSTALLVIERAGIGDTS